MGDLAVEIDTHNVNVSRHFLLTRGEEMGMPGAPVVGTDQYAKHDMSGHGTEPTTAGDISCSLDFWKTTAPR